MIRAFIGTFLGKVAAGLFIALCAALGLGPDWWATTILAVHPVWCIRAALILLALITATAFFGPLVKRKFAERKVLGQIPLLEAARTVFDQTKDSTCAEMARAEGSTKLALGWYCYMLIGVKGDGVTRLMELTGTRPPSRVQELIKFDRPPPDLEIRGDVAILVDRASKRVIAENLTVAKASVPSAVSFILGLDAVGRGVPPNVIVNVS
jgi:hypothetical protein